MSAEVDRYRRQALFSGLGSAGQEKLKRAAVAVVGCGATGGAAAELLGRAGIGRLLLIDRDLVSLDNLHRQVLFAEADVGRPKALAAADQLRRVNSAICIEAQIAHLDATNIEELLAGVSVVMDGTDNVATRFVINDWAFEQGLPWVYVGAVGSEGMLLPIEPPQGPCLRCFLPEPPPPGTLATCDTAGVLGPVPAVMGAMGAAEVMRMIVHGPAPEPAALRSLDLWPWRVHTMPMPIRADCPTCQLGRRDFLEGQRSDRLVEICGRDAQQILPATRAALDLAAIEARWIEAKPMRTEHFLRIEWEGVSMVIFGDGRAMVEGAGDPGRARAFYDRVVGS